jgi:hypothetical protein
MTNTQLIGEVASILHMDSTSGGEDATSIQRALNWAGRYIWTSCPWPERKAVTVLTTVAPYSTGTADFTENSASVTGSGTTWSSFTGRKMATGYNAPFYRVSANGGVTAITLARNYIEDTASGSSYVIYQDEYDTASTVDTITSAHLLVNQTTGPALFVSEERIDSEVTIQAYAGKPTTVGLCIPTTAGTPRIRVTPVPDDVYGIEVKYLKAWTDLSGASDTPVLDANKESLLISVALLFAQRPSDNRVMMDYDRADKLISEYFKKNKSMAPMTFRKRRFDERGSQDWVYWNIV